MGFKVASAARHVDIAGVVNDQDHDSSGNLIAHHGEEDEGGSHKMMEHPFIVFFVIFLDHHQLKNREYMDSQLETEVDLQFCFLVCWPVWKCLIHRGASPTASN